MDIRVIQRNYNGQMLSDFLTQVPTGEGPDLIVAPHDVLGQVVNNGAVSPLDLINPEETFVDIALQAVTYDGRYYGVPFIIENVALLRNNEMTRHTPTDFDDLLREGHRLMDEGVAQYPLHHQPVGGLGRPVPPLPHPVLASAPRSSSATPTARTPRNWAWVVRRAARSPPTSPSWDATGTSSSP
ncbi:extracellular solute-binding protein [Corynebacterium suedekumii]|nr:extracellular solute-binding protein [Corynebacterium suedekumii]